MNRWHPFRPSQIEAVTQFRARDAKNRQVPRVPRGVHRRGLDRVSHRRAPRTAAARWPSSCRISIARGNDALVAGGSIPEDDGGVLALIATRSAARPRSWASS